jgi:serine/threonine protein kinase/tetratricopeptide (TPR) repeat protein
MTDQMHESLAVLGGVIAAVVLLSWLLRGRGARTLGGVSQRRGPPEQAVVTPSAERPAPIGEVGTSAQRDADHATDAVVHDRSRHRDPARVAERRVPSQTTGSTATTAGAVARTDPLRTITASVVPNVQWPPHQMEAAWSPGQEVLHGEFVVLDTLGRGGFGTVYLLETRAAPKGELDHRVRFAAKRLPVSHPAARPRLLRELQAWLDLPTHPHLAPYRFFRSERHYLTIFSEYAPSGSVAHRLYDATPLTLGEVLDIAIQALWALDAVHAVGFVHSDFKPANLLMYDQATVRLSDFGLTMEPGDTWQYRGLTRRYASPEQRRAEPLGPQSDLWSWAISVVEMWAGPGFLSGPNANAHVAALLADGAVPSRRTEPFPAQLSAVLRRCLVPDLAARERSARTVAHELVANHQMWTGYPFGRPMPEEPAAPERGVGSRQSEWVYARHQLQGTDEELLALYSELRSQNPPRPDLVEFLKILVGQLLPFRVTASSPGIGRSAMSQAVHAMAMLEASRNVKQMLLARAEGDDLLRRLVASGPMNVRRALTIDTTMLAAHYRELGDVGGAAQALDEHPGPPADIGTTGRAFALDTENPVALYKEAMLERQKGLELVRVKQMTGGIAAYRRAIAYLEKALQLDDGSGKVPLTQSLSMARFGAAGAYHAAGDAASALAELDAVLALRTDSPDGSFSGDLDLALVFNERGAVLERLRRNDEALTAFDEALAHVARELDQAGVATKGVRARVCRNKAILLVRIGRLPEALPLIGDAVALFEDVVRSDPAWENEHTLADALATAGEFHRRSGDFETAIRHSGRALNIWSRLSDQAGHTELRGHCNAVMDSLLLAAAKVTENIVLNPRGTRIRV